MKTLPIDQDLLMRWANCFSAGLFEDHPSSEEAKAEFWAVSEELYATILAPFVKEALRKRGKL